VFSYSCSAPLLPAQTRGWISRLQSKIDHGLSAVCKVLIHTGLSPLLGSGDFGLGHHCGQLIPALRGFGIATGCGNVEPHMCPYGIPEGTHAIGVGNPKIVLGRGISRFSSLGIQAHRLFEILNDAASLKMQIR